MSLTVVVLAAGLGKRMNSALPKVLHPLCGRPMLHYVIDAVRRLGPQKIFVVVGKHREEIRKSLGVTDISFVLQKEPRGTAHALMEAFSAASLQDGPVLVLNGDMPLITPRTLKKLLALFRKNRDVLVGQTAYGRFVDPANPEVAVLQNVRLSQPVESLTAHPENYSEVVDLQGMDRSLANTTLVTLLVVGGTLATSVVGGYAFARLNFPGRDNLFIVYLGTLMIPFVLLITPLYQLMVRISW